jgi:hypothetical protein
MVRKLFGSLGERIKALNAELKRPLGSFGRERSEAAPRNGREVDRPAVKKKPDADKVWPDLSSSKILRRASATTFGRKIEEKRALKEENRRRTEERLKRLTAKKETDAE